MLRPIPRLPPVTSAVFPRSDESTKAPYRKSPAPARWAHATLASVGDFGDAVQTFRCNRRIWEARKSTPTLLRDARLSTLVTIVGFLEADTSLRAPLTLAPCIVHRIRVGERREDFDMVQVFANGGGRVPFVVVDDEGARVRVGAEEEAIVGPTLVDVTDTALVYGDNDVLGEVIGRANAARAIDAAARKGFTGE